MPTATLEDIAKKNSEDIGALTKSLEGLVKTLSKTPAAGTKPSDVFGLPHVRQGENIMGSRGFSFMKMLGLITGATTPDEGKMESDIHNRLHQCFAKDGINYSYGGKQGEKAFLAPLATSFLQDCYVPANFRKEMRQMVSASVEGADRGEMVNIRRKQFQSMGYGEKAMSWLNELTGGFLVEPPQQGELIELLRNKEALVNAGARVVPLPPQGRLKYPRQTLASNTYWIGESSPITDSTLGGGEVTMQAKKLAVLIKAPNELIRFASPAAEALMRDDMTKSLALGLDLAGLQGAGGDNTPLGLINRQNITFLNSSNLNANGNGIVGQDVYRMIAAIEENNAEMEGFIMRPRTLYKYYQLRADAVAQGDGQGPFLFNLIREAGENTPAMLGGYPVTKSTQISGTQTKGTGTGLTYIAFGMWSDFLIGMFGAIEFAATTLGDTSFVNDQTWVRGILSADVAIRHESAFGVLSQLSTQI